MKKCIILLFALIVSVACAEDTDISNSFAELRETVTKISSENKELIRKKLNIEKHIVSDIKKNEQLKDRLIDEIEELLLTDSRNEHYQYCHSLFGILFDVDVDSFIDLTRRFYSSEDVSRYYKNTLFEQTFIMHRQALLITKPEALSSYDKKLLELGKDIFEIENGAVEERRYYDGNFKKFTSILIAEEKKYPLNDLPPVNRKLGIKLARQAVQDENLKFSQKEWHHRQLARFDESEKEKYLASLKDYIERNDDYYLYGRGQVEYVERLEQAGMIDPEKARMIKKKARGDVRSITSSSDGGTTLTKIIDGKIRKIRIDRETNGKK